MASQDDPLDRSLDEAQRNPGISSSIEQTRIPLRYIRATGMRSTSARGAFFVRTKTNSSGLNLCCKADPKGRSQGCDLQRNSLQQERNQMLNRTINDISS